MLQLSDELASVSLLFTSGIVNTSLSVEASNVNKSSILFIYIELRGLIGMVLGFLLHPFFVASKVNNEFALLFDSILFFIRNINYS
jgi:hypothetical protein